MSEYLRGFRTDRLMGVDYQNMITNRQVLSPKSLIDELHDALIFLTTTPGEHLTFRQENIPDWISWWIDFLGTLDSSSDLLTHSDKLLNLDQIREALLVKGGNSGLLFVAGAEGHKGHRWAAYWMKKHVQQTVWMFEREDYIERKVRGGSLLPLEVRLSLWNYHPHIDFIGVSPTLPNNSNVGNHYQSIFNKSGADYCFASENDPNLIQKIHRGRSANFTTIPILDTPSTTDLVKTLMPDVEEEHVFYTLQLINLIENGRKISIINDFNQFDSKLGEVE